MPRRERELFARPPSPDADSLLITRYKLWRRHVPLLYNTISTRLLDWPAVSIQWLAPGCHLPPHSASDALLLLALYSGCQEDSLNVFKVQEPSASEEQFSISLVSRVSHPGTIYRARAVPQNPSLVASRGSAGVMLTDLCAARSTPLSSEVSEGPSLALSPLRVGLLACGMADGAVGLWAGTQPQPPCSVFPNDNSLITAVDLSFESEHLLAACNEAGRLSLVDRRQAHSSALEYSHGAALRCLALDPSNTSQALAGDSNNLVVLLDWRRLPTPLSSFPDPFAAKTSFPFAKECAKLEWCPDRPSLFACASYDSTVRLWDTKPTTVWTHDDQSDGPPELAFLHGGHTDEVSDVSWSPHNKFTLASVADDNILHVWRPQCLV